jgi:hypothetical protein
MYGYVFPQIGTAIGVSAYPAVNCAYVPSGGPWGFSSSVYDYNLQRVFTTNPITPATTNVFGSDFWINKWGGKDGVDASVRVLGKPDRTVQSTGVSDDVFKDQNGAGMACLAPWYTQISVTSTEQAYIADIRWTASTYFNLPYSPTANALDYDGIGQFYHKIPKSAFLWNLLEAHVAAWNRAVPLAHGDVWCPIYAFDALGVLTPSRLGDFMPKDTTPTGAEGFYLSLEQHDACLANGIVAQTGTDPATGDPYYYVSQAAISNYCGSKGFRSYNFDVTNEQPYAVTPVAATTWIPRRAYGFGETTDGASYIDVTNGNLYRQIRYVDLDVA